MRLSIKALRYFLSAARKGSIARAAEELNVVPSAVSSAIDQVESEFRLKLVHRTPAKGIAPTATGVALLRKVEHLIEEYDSLFRDGAELQSALSGDLAIGYYAPVAPAFLPAVAAPLLRNNPDIRLSLVECDNEAAQEGLLAGTFDLIVFVAEQVRAGIDCQTLLDAPPYLLVAANHPLARKSTVSFTDLQDLPMVFLDLPFTSQYYRGLFDSQGIEPQIVARASSTEMVRSLVGKGVGCAVLNMRPATATSYGGDALVALPLAGKVPALRLVLGHLAGRQRRLTETFATACRAYFDAHHAQTLIVQ